MRALAAVPPRVRKVVPFCSGSPALPQRRVVGGKPNGTHAVPAAYGQRSEPPPDAVLVVGDVTSFCAPLRVSVPAQLKVRSLQRDVSNVGDAREVASLAPACPLAVAVGAAYQPLRRQIARTPPLAR